MKVTDTIMLRWTICVVTRSNRIENESVLRKALGKGEERKIGMVGSDVSRDDE